MQRINPIRLKHWRLERRMTREQLAHRSTIDKTTIYNIEKGSRKGTREHVLQQLAKALAVSPEELTSPSAPQQVDPGTAQQEKSQVSFRMDNGVRNALALVSRRYRIKPATIVKLAPLMFAMVAEDSLRRCSEKLAALRGANDAFGSLPHSFMDHRQHFEDAEENSIQSRDILGRQLDDGSQQQFFEKDADVAGSWNPLANYVEEWFRHTGQSGGISYWGWNGPEYSVCPEEALAIAAGDESLASALLDGTLGIHEIPSELWTADRQDERHEWMRTKVASITAQGEERRRQFEIASKAKLEAISGRFEPAATHTVGGE